MRVSIITEDPGHGEYVAAILRGEGCRVYLDGVILDKCLTADDQLGEVLCYAADQTGAIDQPKRETLKGHVVIQFLDKHGDPIRKVDFLAINRALSEYFAIRED